jgi:hypothetical protein
MSCDMGYQSSSRRSPLPLTAGEAARPQTREMGNGGISGEQGSSGADRIVEDFAALLF